MNGLALKSRAYHFFAQVEVSDPVLGVDPVLFRIAFLGSGT